MASRMMKAAQLEQFKSKIKINQVPIPTLGPNDVLVKTAAAGWCHTDYQVWEGVYGSSLPIVPSHEPVGTVVEIGPEAQGKWQVGQRVGVMLFRHQCGTCLGCETTRDIRFCEKKDIAGLTADGGMAEYVVGDADTMVAVPDSIPFEQAAPLMCAGATIWAAIEATGTEPDQPIGIIGVGGLGQLGVQFAKAIGHLVVAIDDRPEGRELATTFKLAADLVLDFNDPGAVEKVKKWADGGGLAAVVVATDDVPAVKWSTKLLRPRGVLVPVGLPTAGLQLDAFDVVFQEFTVKGSLVSSKKQCEDMLKAVDKFNIRSHVTAVPLEKVPDLPDMYMDPHLKGRLVMKIE